MIDWNSFNTWHLVMPPSRPDEMQLSRISILIENFDRQMPVAVLGSTPEFRDLYHKMGFKNIYVFDKNIIFYNSMKQLMTYAKCNEQFICGDWLDTLPQYSNKFSVILSDLTLGNLNYDVRDRFYSYINKALSWEGIFIDKILIHDHFLNVEQLLQAYEKKPLNLKTANYFNCQMLFCSQLIQINEMVDTTQIYQYLGSLHQYAWLPKLLELTKKITPSDCIWYYGREAKDITTLFQYHFNILAVWEEPVDSPYYFFAHHYLFRRK